MQPTYSLIELKHLLRKLEVAEVSILKQVLAEETELYTSKEITAIEKMIQLRVKFLTRHKINIDLTSSSYN